MPNITALTQILPQSEQALQQLRLCNEDLSAHGLQLSEQQMLDLVEARFCSLRELGRVEFGSGVLPLLARAFADSPYVERGSFAQTLADLQDVFYYIKKETWERIPDDELIRYMKTEFNGAAGGSVEYLAETLLEALSRSIRQRTCAEIDRKRGGY